MKKTLILLSALLLLATLTLSAKKKQQPSQTIYLYALSASFNDTIVYITDIQTVDSAYMERKHILGGLHAYVQQVDRHFAAKGMPHRINTIFFQTKRSKAEKQFVKLRKKYSQSNVSLQILPQGEFTFQAVKRE